MKEVVGEIQRSLAAKTTECKQIDIILSYDVTINLQTNYNLFATTAECNHAGITPSNEVIITSNIRKIIYACFVKKVIS